MDIELDHINRTTSLDSSENDNSIKQNSNEIKCEDIPQKNSENATNKELLGSVTVHNCPGVRTSARVIQKMKQDSVRCTSPPLHDKKDCMKEEKTIQKSSNQSKTSTSAKHTWTNLEKNLFFDALNECGKDFDAIYNFINSKIKKSSSDQSTKTKEQIRHSYYQTFHKLSKYIKFSDEVRKPVQELYALINYGEMRRRLAFVSEKNLMKIRELVYKGHVTVRSKGKSIRIKTPSCKALRKLNQLEGWLEDIKLPSKVEVCLRPATMEAWGRVQNIAQNPVVRTVVPLQKRLVNIIKTFQYRWRSQDTKLNETALKLFGNSTTNDTSTAVPKCDKIENMDQNHHYQQQQQQHLQYQNLQNNEPLICLAPHKNAIVHRPLVSITQYLSSFNICLNSYEERMGVKIRGETLWQERSHNNKRQRTDSGCEKKNSPDNKKCRTTTSSTIDNCLMTTSSTTITTTTTATTIDNITTPIDIVDSNNKDYKDETEDDFCGGNSESELIDLLFDERHHQQQLLNDDCIENSFKNDNCFLIDDGIKDDITNSSNNSNNNGAKLYSSLNDLNKTKKYNKKKDRDSKKDINNLKPLINKETLKKIRQGWTILNSADITIGDLYIVFGHDSKLMFEYYWLNDKHIEFDNLGVPYMSTNKNESIGLMTMIGQQNKIDFIENIHNNQNNLLSNKLKHLLLIANLNERIKRKQCTCGHICGTKTKSLESGDISSKSFISNVTYSASHSSDVNVFRQPVLPMRRTLAVQSFKQVPNGQRVKQPRFLRTGKIGSRQIVVQRLLPVQPGVNQSFDVVTPQLEIRTVQDDTTTLNRRDLNNSSAETTTLNEIENNANKINNYQKDVTNIQQMNDNEDFINDVFTKNDDNESQSKIKNSSDATIINSDVDTPTTSKITDQEFDPDLNPLLELSLPSPLPITSLDDNTNDTLNNIPPMSPMQLLRETSGDSKWLDENIGEFSLTSFLGHLDEINNREDNANISVISESSVDYVSKFAEIASMQNEERDL